MHYNIENPKEKRDLYNQSSIPTLQAEREELFKSGVGGNQNGF